VRREGEEIDDAPVALGEREDVEEARAGFAQEVRKFGV